MAYDPRPFDVSATPVGPWLDDLLEALARHNHDVWARARLDQGWRCGPKRDDDQRLHPSLVPFEDLPESEAQLDRNAALATIQFLLAMGCEVVPPATLRGTAEHLDAKLVRFVEQAGSTSLLALWVRHDPVLWRQRPDLYLLIGDQLLRKGHPLVAVDALQEGLDSLAHISTDTPLRLRLTQLRALALARGGATLSACEALESLRRAGHADVETLGLLARTHKDLGVDAVGQDRRRHLAAAYDLYRQAFGSTGDYWVGLNAATMAVLIGDRAAAIDLATQVEAACERALRDLDAGAGVSLPRYWAYASLGESFLIRRDLDRAGEWYDRAVAQSPHDVGVVASTRRNARLLVQTLDLDWNQVAQHLPVPIVVVAAGHMIDRPDRPCPRFPQHLESSVGRDAATWLRSVGPAVLFSSAACGADIIVLEQASSLGMEIHVVLPYDVDQFRRDSVDIAGGTWGERFAKILESAATVSTVSANAIPFGSLSFSHANHVVLGAALLHARALESEVRGLCIWDGQPGDGPGGTASIVQMWSERGIGYHQIRPPASPSTTQARAIGRTRTVTAPPVATAIRAFLFADIAAFSRLAEEAIPAFVSEVMARVGDLARCSPDAPLVANTWGDGIYMVFDDVGAAGRFALALRETIEALPWADVGLPPLGVRIALHTGPAFRCVDPVTARETYTGNQVSRAARIEPATPTNSVYASREFAALAAFEGVESFTTEYVGMTILPKKFGTFPLYHVRRRQTPTMSPPDTATPHAFVLMGLPGSGKTLVGRHVAERTGAAMIQAEVLRRDYAPSPFVDQHDEKTNRLVYDALLARGERILRDRRHVVLDATFARRDARRRALEVAERAGAVATLVHIGCDEHVAEERMRNAYGDDAEERIVGRREASSRMEPIDGDAIAISTNSLASLTRAVDTMLRTRGWTPQ